MAGLVFALIALPVTAVLEDLFLKWWWPDLFTGGFSNMARIVARTSLCDLSISMDV